MERFKLSDKRDKSGQSERVIKVSYQWQSQVDKDPFYKVTKHSLNTLTNVYLNEIVLKKYIKKIYIKKRKIPYTTKDKNEHGWFFS